MDGATLGTARGHRGHGEARAGLTELRSEPPPHTDSLPAPTPPPLLHSPFTPGPGQAGTCNEQHATVRWGTAATGTMDWDAPGLSCGQRRQHTEQVTEKQHLFRFHSTLHEEGIKGNKVRAHVVATAVTSSHLPPVQTAQAYGCAWRGTFKQVTGLQRYVLAERKAHSGEFKPMLKA